MNKSKLLYDWIIPIIVVVLVLSYLKDSATVTRLIAVAAMVLLFLVFEYYKLKKSRKNT